MTALFWVAFTYDFFYPFPEPFTTVISWSGIILAVLHLMEFVFKKAELDAIGAGGLHGFCQTLLFGFLYWLPLLKQTR
jgi:uncharacterized protein YhhL (DUF1145 family)